MRKIIEEIQNLFILKRSTPPKWIMEDLKKKPWRLAKAGHYSVYTDGVVSFSMIAIPGYPFAISETPVTQQLWKSIVGNNPSANQENELCPVERVSHNDCLYFINTLNNLTGKKFRLPTALEWRIAAQGGSRNSGRFRFSGSDEADAVAWYSANSSGKTHPVKTKQPNDIGIYDLSGNVFEHTSSHEQIISPDYTPNFLGLNGSRRNSRVLMEETYRYIILGGCYLSNERDLEPGHDKARAPDVPDCHVGFRIAIDC